MGCNLVPYAITVLTVAYSSVVVLMARLRMRTYFSVNNSGKH